ncbi:ABC transporter ATP-binding protein [Patescibacteria group bacterium]
MNILEIKNLKAGYEDIPVLKEVDLELEQDKIAILMGPNGAGKTTLLKSIFNQTNITGGQIFFEGKEITKMPTHGLLEMGIAYVPQGRINFSDLTVEENLLMGAYHLEDKDVIKKNVEKIYEEFPDLKTKKKELAFSLSGGQQQMLAIGRALVNRPRLLLLDEPSLGLSPKLVKKTFAKIKEINQKFDTTILIVEHNIKSVLEMADYGYIMVDGQIETHGAAKELKGSAIMKKVFLGVYD